MRPNVLQFWHGTALALDGRPCRQYRWRLKAGNGEQWCNPGEWFTEQRGAHENAAASLGLIYRPDVKIADPEHRAAVAKILAQMSGQQWPGLDWEGLTESGWEARLDPKAGPA